MRESPQLPAWATLTLRLVVRREDAEFILGDLEEAYGRQYRRQPGGAPRWLRRQVLGTCVQWWTAGARRARRNRNGTGGGGGMGALIQDIQAGLRSIVRRPGLAVVVVGTLGLGIGATTTIYSVVDGVLLRPLPYDDAQELVSVGTTFPGREWEEGSDDLMHLAGSSLLNYRDMKERARSFESFGAVEWSSVLLPDEGDGPELVTAARVDEGFFETLNLAPAMGRSFTDEEYRDGAYPLILSHGAWVRRYGGDPAVIGSTLGNVGDAYTIVGVLPADFDPPEAMFGTPPEFWMPLQPDHDRYASRGRRSLVMVARLADGVTVDQAREEMQGIADALAVDFPDGNVYPDGSHFGAGVNGLREQTVGTTGRILMIFLASAALLLLIAILNAASLLLARALDRTRELGVRRALGAGGARIMRLLLTESVLLSALGGLVGVALAYGGVWAFHNYGPSSVPRMDEVVVDARILAVVTTLAVFSGVFAGLLPALRVASRPMWARLQGNGSRGASESGGRLRTAMVAGQLGIAVLLLSGAGLLFHSFLKLKGTDPGFEPQGLVSLQVGTKRPGAPEGEASWQAWDLVLDEFRAVPGLLAVAGTSNVPYQSTYWAPRILLPGDSDDTWRDGIHGYAITPGYHEAIGTRVLQGREFTAADGPAGPSVALVNEAFARAFIGEAQPLGFRFRMPESESLGGETEVVGVVEDAIQGRPEDGVDPAIYVPYTQAEWPFVQVVVRADRPMDVLAPELRQAVARFNPVIPPQGMGSMEARMARTRTDPRFQALLLGTFAAVAMLLAGTGLFASLSHAVGRRKRELGIRMALGAERWGVLRMVVTQGLRVAGVGLVLGLVGAVAANRVLRGFLYEVDPLDPLTLTAVGVLLSLVAAVASWVPARRATTVDPVTVLKAE